MAARSGQRLRRHVVTDAPVVPFEEMGMPLSEVTLAELLRDAGHHTVHIGRLHIGRASGMRPRDQGFDESLLLARGLYRPGKNPEVVNSRRDFDPLDRHTLVVFTSDNGMPAYVGLPDLNHPFRGWKMTFFEGGIRVPTFLRWPGHLPAAAVYEEPVHGVDSYATAAAAAGMQPPADRVLDGVDLVAHVRGEVAGRPHPRLFWRAGHYRVVRDGDRKLQVAKRPRRRWLFDLARDPTEREKLASRETERVRALLRILEEHDARRAEPLWPSVVEIPVNVDGDLSQPDEPDHEYVYTPN